MPAEQIFFRLEYNTRKRLKSCKLERWGIRLCRGVADWANAMPENAHSASQMRHKPKAQAHAGLGECKLPGLIKKTRA